MPWIIAFKDPTEKLDSLAKQIGRMQIQMSEMEAKLDTVIDGLKGTVAQVIELIGQILAKLEAADTPIDISDETASLETLQADLQSAVDNATEQLPPAEEQPV